MNRVMMKLPLIGALILATLGALLADTKAPAVTKVPTSQPITIRTSKDLAALSNNLSYKTITIARGAKLDASAKVINWQHVLLEGDPNDPPTLRLPASQEFRWLFNTAATTSDVTIRSIHGDFAGARSGFLHVLGGDQIRLVGCSQNVGNVLWCEGATGRVYVKDHVPGGPADKYQICTFTAPVQELIIDERGVPSAGFFQGSNESTIRDMRSVHSVFLGVHVYGSGYKYAWQDRAGGVHEHIDCTVDGGKHHANSCLTVGWMAASAGIPASSFDESDWVYCTLDGLTQENATCKVIRIVGTTIDGKVTNKTIRN